MKQMLARSGAVMKYVDYVIYCKEDRRDIACLIVPPIYKISILSGPILTPGPVELLAEFVPADYRDNIIETGVFRMFSKKRIPHFQNRDIGPMPDKFAKNVVKETFRKAKVMMANDSAGR